MKTKITLLLTATLFLLSGKGFAQIAATLNDYFEILPKWATIDNEAKIHVWSDDESNQVQIYKKGFTEEKTITFKVDSFKYEKIIAKDTVVAIIDCKLDTETYYAVKGNNDYYSISYEYILECIENAPRYKVSPNNITRNKSLNDSTIIGDTGTNANFYNEYIYGKKYPRSGFIILSQDENTIAYMRVNIWWEESYTGEWEEIENPYGNNYYSYVEPICVGYVNLDDEDSHDGDGEMLVTQNMFNTDEKYEYLFPKYSVIEKRHEESDRNYDEEIDYISTVYGIEISALNIISEDGSIVKTIPLERTASDIDFAEFIKWDGKIYMALYCEYEYDYESFEYEEEILIYLLDSGTNSLKRVAANNGLMKVLPSITKKNTPVAVMLDAETREKGGTLVVTDMNGRTVYSRPVSAGTEKIQLPTLRLNKGVYAVSFACEGKKIEASKLIVQ